MKNKYLLIISLIISLTSRNIFAENFDQDIYEDGMVSAENNENAYKQKNRKTNKSNYPNIEGNILAEYYIDILNSSSNKVSSSDKLTNSYLKIKSNFKMNLNKNFFIETDWFLRPVNSRLYTNDSYANIAGYTIGNSSDSDFYGKENYIKRKFQFSSYGLGIETLSFNFKNKNLGFGIGKINPTFGLAFDKARFTGIYGTILPEEYKLTEKIGGYISAIFPFGTLRFNSFFDDTTELSRTAFNDRGKDNSKGGAGNTKQLNNFSLTFDAKFDDLRINLGYRELKSDINNRETERGFVVGLEYLFDLGYDISFLPFAELSYFDNFDAMSGRNMVYFTTFLPVIYENWHFIASTTIKHDNEKGYNNYTSYLNQLSLGYNFDCGLMIDIAKIWNRNVKKTDDFTIVDSSNGKKWVKHQDSWALMISYLFKF